MTPRWRRRAVGALFLCQFIGCQKNEITGKSELTWFGELSLFILGMGLLVGVMALEFYSGWEKN